MSLIPFLLTQIIFLVEDLKITSIQKKGNDFIKLVSHEFWTSSKIFKSCNIHINHALKDNCHNKRNYQNAISNTVLCWYYECTMYYGCWHFFKFVFLDTKKPTVLKFQSSLSEKVLRVKISAFQKLLQIFRRETSLEHFNFCIILFNWEPCISAGC